jgi:hypothetical protein
VAPGTIAKGNTWWRRWVEFMHNCELDDDMFLIQFTQHERHLLLGAFAQRVRDNEWSKSSKGYDHLVASTCRTAIESGVSQAFVRRFRLGRSQQRRAWKTCIPSTAADKGLQKQ